MPVRRTSRARCRQRCAPYGPLPSAAGCGAARGASRFKQPDVRGGQRSVSPPRFVRHCLGYCNGLIPGASLSRVRALGWCKGPREPVVTALSWPALIRATYNDWPCSRYVSSRIWRGRVRAILGAEKNRATASRPPIDGGVPGFPPRLQSVFCPRPWHVTTLTPAPPARACVAAAVGTHASPLLWVRGTSSAQHEACTPAWPPPPAAAPLPAAPCLTC